MRQHVRHEQAENQLLFLPGVFNETLGLLFDAHHYFQSRGPEEQASIEPSNRIHYASEMSRVTLRLTSVMAWLMVRRAVYAGRIEEEYASLEYRLSAQDVCTTSHDEILPAMPRYLAYLAERSLNLYERIQRLDTEAYGTSH